MTQVVQRGRHRAAAPTTPPAPARTVMVLKQYMDAPPTGMTTRTVVGLCTAAAVLAGGLAAVVGMLAAAVVVGAALFLLCAFRPVAAVYVYVATLPFLAGIDRNTLLPLVRPNEAVLALVMGGAVCGLYLRYLRGDEMHMRLRPLDVPLAVFVLLSTLWPISWLLLRGYVPGADDWAALLPIVKLTGLLVLVRTTVRTEAQLIRLARLIIWPAAAIAVIAVLQTLQFPLVLTLLLKTYWPIPTDPAEVFSRGTTTLASPIATGDYITIGATLLLTLGMRGLIRRRELLALGGVLVAGALAAGQFSTWASMLVLGVALLHQYPRLRKLAIRGLPLLAVAALIGSPAFLARLSEFGDGFGVPSSWLGRWDNLVSFYLPGLGHFRWVLGVGPNSVLAAPETWRSVIYLEYGYLQFLWVGGLPLLGAFLWLSVGTLRSSRRLAVRPDAVGAYASAFWAAWWMVMVLSVIDIHLVLRGAGELFFIGLAVISGRADDA